MKNILIRLGKIKSVIRRDGVIAGARTLVTRYGALYLRTLFTPVSGDVLIITAGVGDSALYRAFNYAEELNTHGIATSVVLSDHPFLFTYAKKGKVFIFQRTLVTPAVAKLIRNIKQAGKAIIFECDDLVFNPQFIQKTDLYKNNMNAAEKMQYRNGVGEEIIKDPYTKACTTTTSYLAQIMRQYGTEVFVVTNKLSCHELTITQKIVDTLPKEDDGTVRIGYFSGTSSHNKDFASIADALMDIMEKYKNVTLYLAGPLDIESRLGRYKERVATLPFVARDKYYENIWKVHINLAPLVVGDPFCESKSAIKFIEAGILGIPTVAVRNQTFSETIEDGVDGFLADHREEWVQKISRLVDDKQYRYRMGAQAREKVLRDFTNKNSHTDDYYQYLKALIRR